MSGLSKIEMFFKKIRLKDFRNYSQKEFDFSKTTTLVVGANASGKTNLLEAVFLLARGRSFRAKMETEMVSYTKEFARVEGEVEEGGEKILLAIVLADGRINGERTMQKRYFVNGVGRRMMDFVGNLRCVYFGPEDLEIIIDSPAIRRDYLDAVLEQIDREYRRASLSYKKGLRQRNRLLEQIRDEGKPRSILFFWDKLLIENGEVLTQKREEFINFVNVQPDYFGKLRLTYDKSVISPQRLENYAEEEVAAGMTLVGPHRDNFLVSIEEESGKSRDLSIFGSRGEQRTAIFSLKLAELDFVIQKTGKKPILLLDDIFSELDQKHRERLLEVIPRQQTIITTTDLHLVELEYRKKMEIVKLD